MSDTYIFSAPGRTELGGNHTDHQRGCVLAAAVDLETTAEVTLNGTDVIRVFSEGYAPVEVCLDDLGVHTGEENTTAALVRGVAAEFVRRGAEVRGFDAHVHSNVLPGSGLSSSAAFEASLFRPFSTAYIRSGVPLSAVTGFGAVSAFAYTAINSAEFLSIPVRSL